MSGRLEGRRIAVVGAGQTAGDTEGNGRAISRIFSGGGASLLLVDRDRASAEQTAQACPGECHVVEVDVTSSDSGARIAEAAGERLGGLDGLVYVVGVGDAGDGIVDTLTEEGWDRIMSVNLSSARRVMGGCLPLLRESGNGAIVAISSLAALAPSPMVAYSVSKAGLNRMIESMAFHESRRGVRCNAITPGLIDTPMAIEGLSQRMGVDKAALRQAREQAVPMGRMGTAEDVAYAALYLISHEARFVTGAILPVDGGSSVKVAL